MAKRSKAAKPQAAKRRPTTPAMDPRPDPLQLPVRPEIQQALDRHRPATALPKVQPMPAVTSSMAPLGRSPAAEASQSARALRQLISSLQILEAEEQFRQDLGDFGVAAMMVRPAPQEMPATQVSTQYWDMWTPQGLQLVLLGPISPQHQDLEMRTRLEVVKELETNPPPFQSRLRILLWLQDLLVPLMIRRRQVWRLVFQMHMMKAPWMLVVEQQRTRQELLLQEMTSHVILLVMLASTLLQIKDPWKHWILQKILQQPSSMEKRLLSSR